MEVYGFDNTDGATIFVRILDVIKPWPGDSNYMLLDPLQRGNRVQP
jgi:hypothetical protein